MRRLIACLVVAACGEDGTNNMDGPDAGGSGSGRDGGGSGSGDDMLEIPATCVAGRTTIDRPDDVSLDQVRLLYVVPSDITDASRDTNGQICNSARGFATWFHAQAGAYLRFDTYNGELDVGFVRLTKTDATLRGTDPSNSSIETGTAFVVTRVERELTMMGLIESNKLYAVYYEGSSSYSCGAGAYPPLIQARVGAMYLGGLPSGQTTPCGQVLPWGQPSLKPSYIDYGMLHELVHSMGIVPDSSPNEHAAGHVFDANAIAPNRDLMYSPRPGQNDPGWATNDPAGLILDLGKDDYFTAGTVELSTMSLLAPLPTNATRPNGW